MIGRRNRKQGIGDLVSRRYRVVAGQLGIDNIIIRVEEIVDCRRVIAD
jgi:hypothetical protein